MAGNCAPVSFIESAAKHREETADNVLHEIDVPEIGEDVYFKSIAGMNGTQFNLYMKYMASEDYDIRIVDQFILRALNKDGTKMHRTTDKPQLMNKVDPMLMGKIVNEMARVDNSVSAEEKKG